MSYQANTGRLTTIQSTSIGSSLQNLSLTWDALGNLKQRKEQGNSRNLTENFGYDSLNRLTSAQVVGSSAQTVAYNGIGNINIWGQQYLGSAIFGNIWQYLGSV